MPADLPYMIAVGNVPAILDRIRGAGTPPKFNREFLSSSLGFTASQDRGMIKVLKQAGFLTADSTPTPRYNEFKSSSTGGQALAQGLREGWAPIFLADQRANERTTAQLVDLFKSVTGQGDSVTQKMASTFKALASKADWSTPLLEPAAEDGSLGRGKPNGQEAVLEAQPVSSGINLHQDFHIHLPPTSDVSVYRAIFRALREELL
jgi:hypothetical protein